jgi:hypothetical protein
VLSGCPPRFLTAYPVLDGEEGSVMARRTAPLLALLLVVTAACVGAGQSLAPSHEAAARGLLRTMMTGGWMYGMSQVVTTMVLPDIEKKLGGFSQQERERARDALGRVVFEMFSSRDFEDAAARIYADYFTESEIEGLTQFYRTPLGEKILRTQARLTADLQTAGEKIGTRFDSRVEEELRRALPGRKF